MFNARKKYSKTPPNGIQVRLWPLGSVGRRYSYFVKGGTNKYSPNKRKKGNCCARCGGVTGGKSSSVEL